VQKREEEGLSRNYDEDRVWVVPANVTWGKVHNDVEGGCIWLCWKNIMILG
jgi:hypothetical protein